MEKVEDVVDSSEKEAESGGGVLVDCLLCGVDTGNGSESVSETMVMVVG